MLGTTDRSRIVRLGHLRVRYRPWYPNPQFAQVLYVRSATLPTPTMIESLCARLRDVGFIGVITGALHTEEQVPFRSVGFTLKEQLQVLHHNLRDIPIQHRTHIRRPKRNELEQIVDIDNSAFEHDWQLDSGGLQDARHATTRSRFRIAEFDDRLTGYAITGRGRKTGYIQRLAVSPHDRRKNIASDLVIDALRWLSRKGTTEAFVNTQLHNDAALNLYKSLGFVHDDSDLSIMVRNLS